jgi:hypothetical protein
MVEGVGGELIFPEGHGHFCIYKIIRGSIRKLSAGVVWVERCYCGRCKEFDRKYIDEVSKSPTRTIRWYDAEGNLERVTGDK